MSQRIKILETGCTDCSFCKEFYIGKVVNKEKFLLSSNKDILNPREYNRLVGFEFFQDPSPISVVKTKIVNILNA